MRMPGPRGNIGHAEIEIGGSRIMLADEYQAAGRGATARSISAAIVASMRLPPKLKQRRCPSCRFGLSHL
jgi:uncharacterized glyoxalase superfamily protein PhnB